MEAPRPSNRLHNFQIFVGTMAGLVSILAGALSIKSGFFSQGEIYGQLQGIVRDERLAKPLVLATVQIFNQQDEVVSTLSTDDEGAYLLQDVKEGSYQLKASAPLHRTEEKKVMVEKKRVTTVDFYLVPTEMVREFPEELPPPSYENRPPYYNEYDSPRTAPMDEGMRRRPPTPSEAWVKAGTLLFNQYFKKKNQTGTE